MLGRDDHAEHGNKLNKHDDHTGHSNRFCTAIYHKQHREHRQRQQDQAADEPVPPADTVSKLPCFLIFHGHRRPVAERRVDIPGRPFEKAPPEADHHGWGHQHKQQHHAPEYHSHSSQVQTNRLRFSVALQLFRLVGSDEGVDQLVQSAVHDGVDFIERQADAVVGDAALREIVGADALVAHAGADLAAALGGDGGFDARLLDLIELGSQHLHALFPVLHLTALLLTGHDNAGRLVDEAHGAHLPFGDGNYFPDGALQEGADLVIQSLHKTLPSLTQTAILHLKSQILDAKKVEQYLSVYQSSSPSYILIASMENCVRYMAEKGAGEMARYGARLRELREKLAKLKHFRLLKEEICGAAGVYGYDPSKLVLFPDFMTGTRLAEVLRTEYHLEAEMSSGRYALLMTSFMDTEEGFSRLERALLELDARVESVGLKDAKQGRQEPFSGAQSNQKPNQENDLENYPQQMCLPWQAWHGDGMLVPLEEAEGRAARTCVTIYPPGVPMLMPGEQIGTREIARIREDWKLGLTVEGICEKSDKLDLWIEVVI